MSEHRYDVAVVGSGTGGATVARELSRRGYSVVVLERGQPETNVGTFRDATRYYDTTAFAIPRKSKEGVIVWRTLMAGGSSVVACANAARALEGDLAALGIDLTGDYVEIEAELGVAPTPESLLSEGGRAIRDAAHRLGYTWNPMPKYLDFEKCEQCGLCNLGCKEDAHWTALDYLEEAQAHGATVLYGIKVERVLVENGRVVGVSGRAGRETVQVRADVVVLSAGGLGTPVILQKSGIEAGRGLFLDYQMMTYGLTRDCNQSAEPLMAGVNTEFHAEGFILSQLVNWPRQVRMMEAGAAGFALPNRRLLGMMAKVADERAGCVHADGTITKPVTALEEQRITRGREVSTEILIEAGADPDSIVYSNRAGSHPGGTAAIGEVVDTDLATPIENLYVSDASVFPETPGLPPIVTIIALSRRLARHIDAH